MQTDNLKKPERKRLTSLFQRRNHTVDGRNPANRLRLVVYPNISKVLYIPGGAGFLPSTVSGSFHFRFPRKETVIIQVFCFAQLSLQLKNDNTYISWCGWKPGGSSIHGSPKILDGDLQDILLW